MMSARIEWEQISLITEVVIYIKHIGATEAIVQGVPPSIGARGWATVDVVIICVGSVDCDGDSGCPFSAMNINGSGTKIPLALLGIRRGARCSVAD